MPPVKKKPAKSVSKSPAASAGMIQRRMYLIRGYKVMLDADLAELYQVPTSAFNQAVKRNEERFPDDFMFQLSPEEATSLRSQSVILDKGRGRHPKYAPYAFTEHGVAMLASILRSRRAAQMSILIVRAFIRMREILAHHKDLAGRVEKLEFTQKQHGSVLIVLADDIEELKRQPEPHKRRIGFLAENKAPILLK